jgi:hypothetical protein
LSDNSQDEARNGKKAGILYGKTKKPVAMIVPYEEKAAKARFFH